MVRAIYIHCNALGIIAVESIRGIMNAVPDDTTANIVHVEEEQGK